jgi:hypothetical protein
MRPRIKLQHKLRLFSRRLPKSTAFRYEQGSDAPQVLAKRRTRTSEILRESRNGTCPVWRQIRS